MKLWITTQKRMLSLIVAVLAIQLVTAPHPGGYKGLDQFMKYVLDGTGPQLMDEIPLANSKVAQNDDPQKRKNAPAPAT